MLAVMSKRGKKALLVHKKELHEMYNNHSDPPPAAEELQIFVLAQYRAKTTRSRCVSLYVLRGLIGNIWTDVCFCKKCRMDRFDVI